MSQPSAACTNRPGRATLWNPLMRLDFQLSPKLFRRHYLTFLNLNLAEDLSRNQIVSKGC
jgi:hypothetical protein